MYTFPGREPSQTTTPCTASTIPGGPYVYIGSVTTNSYDDNNVVAGTTYYYVVRKADATGAELCQSNEATASPDSCNVPEFLSPVLPAALITGFAAAIMLIRGTRKY